MSLKTPQRILIVGSGGREHAIAWKIRQHHKEAQLFFAPGNGGTATLGANIGISATDVKGIVAFANDNKIELTIIGPETALEAGVSNALTAAGHAVFGPTKEAAQLETSKAFSAEFMSAHNIRLEVMQLLEKKVDSFVEQFLIPVEKIWQPTDFLPNSEKETFFDEVKELREIAKDLPYDFWVVMVGDTITEEALPTYESWLMEVEGVDNEGNNGWSKWVRQWTGEENRHGDLLNKYLYLSGRVNMREVEVTTQHLINDGFDIGTGKDPYKNFVYTSFQELATYISHNRVSQIAKKFGDNKLSKMCKMIAGDEMRHHHAY